MATTTSAYSPASTVADDEKQQQDSDNQFLERVGYKPTLYRTLNAFQSFSFGFAEIEVLGAFFTYTYPFGIAIGGPAVIMWSFILGWFMALLIALCLAEIAAVFPYAGGVYNWTAQLAPPDKAPLACYICGWANFIANAAGDAVIAYSFSQLFNALLIGGGGKGYNFQQEAGVGILILLLFSLFNLLRVDKVGWFTGFATICEIAAIFLILISLLVQAPEYNSGHFVFSDFENFSGWADKSYVIVIGMTAGLTVWSGYDAPGHMAEETNNAGKASSMGIIYTVFIGGLVAIPLLFVMLYCTVKDEYGYFKVYSGVTPNAAVNLLMIICGDNYGVGMSCLALVAVFASGISSVSSTTRVMFAMTRDNALPYSQLFSEVHPVLKNPMYGVVFVFIVDALILLMCLSENGGLTAFYAILSIATLGFFVSYTIPIMTKLIYQPEVVANSPLSLGYFSNPLGVVSCLYMMYMMIITFFPLTHPVTLDNNNWLVVVASGFTFLFGLNWLIFARHDFKGPKVMKLLPPTEAAATDEIVKSEEITVIAAESEIV